MGRRAVYVSSLFTFCGRTTDAGTLGMPPCGAAVGRATPHVRPSSSCRPCGPRRRICSPKPGLAWRLPRSTMLRPRRRLSPVGREGRRSHSADSRTDESCRGLGSIEPGQAAAARSLRRRGWPHGHRTGVHGLGDVDDRGKLVGPKGGSRHAADEPTLPDGRGRQGERLRGDTGCPAFVRSASWRARDAGTPLRRKAAQVLRLATVLV